MKKIFAIIIVFICLFTFTACDNYTMEPVNQLVKNGTVVSVSDGQVEVNVAGNLFMFDGDGYTVGESVRVVFDTNGDPTNPWVWWVIDCLPCK